MEPARKARQWSGKTLGTKAGHRSFFLLVRLLGRRCAGVFLFLVVPFYYAFVPRAHAGAEQYGRRRFPGASRLRLAAFGFQRVLTFANVLLDRVVLHVRGASAFAVDFPDTQRLRDALALGKGVIILSAHIGSWEVVSRFFSRLASRVAVVLYDAERPEIAALYRREAGPAALPFDRIYTNDPIEAALRIHQVLEDNGIVVMHADRLTSGARSCVTFMGEAAWFPLSPYRMAAQTGSAIVVAFAVRTGHLAYRAMALPHFTIAGRSDADSVAGLRRYVAALEGVLEVYPQQWFNFYDFWAGNEHNEARPDLP